MGHSAAARAVLAVCFGVLLVNAGARFAIGLLLKPMAQDLDWSRTELSAAVTVFMIVAAASLPLTGRWVDRFGARRVLTVAMLASAIGIGTLPLVTAPWQLLVLYGVVFSLGSAGTSITPIGVLLSRWYPDRLGMANSIAISGMGLGQLLVISALAGALDAIGWQGAYLILGGLLALMVLPLALIPPVADAPAPPARIGAGPALRGSRLRWLLVVYAICGFQDFLMATHVVAFALDEGVSSLLAGQMFALMGLAGLAGVLITGWVNDRTGPIVPTVGCFVLRLVLFGALLMTRDPWLIVFAALTYGATFWMTAPLTVVFAREVAAASALGVVSGIITMVHHGAGGLGALVGAGIFDGTGSYDVAIALMAGLSAAGLGATLIAARAPRLTST